MIRDGKTKQPGQARLTGLLLWRYERSVAHDPHANSLLLLGLAKRLGVGLGGEGLVRDEIGNVTDRFPG